MTDITINDLAKAFRDHSADVKEGFEILKTKAAETGARLDEMEQKAARGGGPADGVQTKSLGQQFIEQEGFKSFAVHARNGEKFNWETKATITTATTNAPGSVGAGIQAYRDPTITPLPQRRPVVRDLLPVIQMSGSAVEVVSIKGRNNNAATVAEADAKPDSDVQLDLQTIPARVIAHWMKASRQVLDDLPQLQGLIDTELLDGLALAEEAQLLNGSGTGQNLRGLIPAATAFAAPITIASPTMLDTVQLALLQSALAEHPANGVIMHPADWARITMLKDADGNYIMGQPGSTVAQRLWGLPVVTTQAIEVDKFLVGDFQAAATLYDRWSARVESSYINDDFTRNLVTVLAEERLALAIKAPKALTYGDFGNVA